MQRHNKPATPGPITRSRTKDAAAQLREQIKEIISRVIRNKDKHLAYH